MQPLIPVPDGAAPPRALLHLHRMRPRYRRASLRVSEFRGGLHDFLRPFTPPLLACRPPWRLVVIPPIADSSVCQCQLIRQEIRHRPGRILLLAPLRCQGETGAGQLSPVLSRTPLPAFHYAGTFTHMIDKAQSLLQPLMAALCPEMETEDNSGGDLDMDPAQETTLHPLLLLASPRCADDGRS